MKKLLTILLALGLTLSINQAYATNKTEAGAIRQYLPPATSDYFNIKFTHGIWVDKNIDKVIVYAYGARNNLVDTLQVNVKTNDIIYVDFYCNNNYIVTFWDGNKKIEQYTVKKSTATRVCPPNSIEISDYVPAKNQYASDTFKDTVKPIEAPKTNGGTSIKRIK